MNIALFILLFLLSVLGSFAVHFFFGPAFFIGIPVFKRSCPPVALKNLPNDIVEKKHCKYRFSGKKILFRSHNFLNKSPKTRLYGRIDSKPGSTFVTVYVPLYGLIFTVIWLGIWGSMTFLSEAPLIGFAVFAFILGLNIHSFFRDRRSAKLIFEEINDLLSENRG